MFPYMTLSAIPRYVMMSPHGKGGSVIEVLNTMVSQNHYTDTLNLDKQWTLIVERLFNPNEEQDISWSCFARRGKQSRLLWPIVPVLQNAGHKGDNRRQQQRSHGTV